MFNTPPKVLICGQRVYLDGTETKLVPKGPDAACLFCSEGTHVLLKDVEHFSNYQDFFREPTQEDIAKTAIHTVTSSVVKPVKPLVTLTPAPSNQTGVAAPSGSNPAIDIEPESQLTDADLKLGNPAPAQ